MTALYKPVFVDIDEEFGWQRREVNGVTMWSSANASETDISQLPLTAGNSIALGPIIDGLLEQMSDHFAIVVQGKDWAFAAVDWVRSIPVSWITSGGSVRIDNQALRLCDKLNDNATKFDPAASLSLAMAGYTIDTATLISSINQLGPGEYVLFQTGRPMIHKRYYCYRPWRADKASYNAGMAEAQLAETTLSVVDAMMRSIGDRQLVVPLSAGNDSRLIVSAAHHLGYRNILTFTYGRSGNHEAKTSELIANRLGYPWHFVETDTAFMKAYYSSREFDGYMRYADSLQSAPFVQDMPQIKHLKDKGYIPDDAVFANGNSGDYISGAHISRGLEPHKMQALSGPERHQRILEQIYNKHFALWTLLKTAGNEIRIKDLLEASLSRANANSDSPENDYGVYEYSEFQDRQCKYVITGQRIYEYLGHEWRMPLWSKPYLDFFEALPFELKFQQNLYIRMLKSHNWGNVWQDIPVNRRTIKPNWIRPIRWFAKAAHLPFGRTRWHAFEKRYFKYWMENGSHAAIVPYTTVLRDRRGARSGIAWLTSNYLMRHDIDMNGFFQ